MENPVPFEPGFCRYGRIPCSKCYSILMIFSTYFNELDRFSGPTNYLYKIRYLVENAFLHLKRWRGIATRYAKTSASFLAAVQISCIALWLKILA
jgi:hypothetical protein